MMHPHALGIGQCIAQLKERDVGVLRDQFLEEGLSGRAARWGLAIRRTGQARAAPHGRPSGRGKLDPHRAFFAEIIAQDGDITMPELASALHDVTGVRVHPSAIGKFLRKLGYTHKKVAGGRRAVAIDRAIGPSGNGNAPR